MTSAAEAARALAEVLLAQADHLASDELATISAAMTEVRAGARGLQAALAARGWGGGVLYGLGEPPDDDVEDGFDGWADDEDESEPWRVPAGARMTYQGRFDFVVVDEELLAAHVQRRARELGQPWNEELLEHGAFYAWTYLEGFGSKDFEGTGLAFAGGQEAVHEIPVTLWELAGDEPDDQFPTAT